jgi:polygalacturonase
VLKNIPVEQRVFGTEGGAFGDPLLPGLRPSFIQPVRCRNVLLEGFTIQGYGPFWTIHPLYCENVIIRGVRVHTKGGANADGIDLDSTRNVLVEYCYLDTGDDAIAVHTGTNAEGRRIGKPTENVVVRHTMVRSGHGGMVVGSLTSGGVKNVFVHDCTYDGTDRGIRLKSNKSRGGVVENLWYRDIKMRRIRNEAIIIDSDYKAAFPAGAGQADYPTFRNITIENVTCDGARVAASVIASDEVPIENLVMRNVSIRAAKGMHFRSVRGLNLINVNVKVSEGNPMTFTNCEEVHQQ